MTRVKRFLNI